MTRLFDTHQRPVQSRRAWYVVETALLLLATICLGWYGYQWIAAGVDQIWSNYSLDARLTGRSPSVRGFLRHVVNGEPQSQASQNGESAEAGPAEGEQAARAPEWPDRIAKGEDIGRIEIPRLGISSIVRQGVDDGTLSRAVGHVPYTPLPGQQGNVGLAAHRDTYFRNLKGIKEGDVIRLVTAHGTFEYSVDSLKIVLPTNVEVLDPTPHPSVTLVTCYPFNFVGHAPKRFIVRARQIQPTSVAAPRRTLASR